MKIKLHRLFFLFAFSLPAGFTLTAQQTTFGVHMDPMVCWYQTEREVSNDGFRIGLRGGLELDRYFAHRYAFSTGIFWQQAGGRLIYADSIAVRTLTGIDSLAAGVPFQQKIQTLGIPLGLKFKTDEIGYLTFFVNLGLVPQIRLKAEATGKSGPLDGKDIREEIAALNLGYQLGAGAEYSMGGSTYLIIGISYHGGITSISTRETEQVYLKNLGIRLGILF